MMLDGMGYLMNVFGDSKDEIMVEIDEKDENVVDTKVNNSLVDDSP